MQPRRIAGVTSALWEQEKRERIRKINAETEGLRLRNAAKRRELYRADDVKRDLAELLTMVRTRLATVPAECADCFPPEIRDYGCQRVGDRVALLNREIDGWIFDYEPPAVLEEEND